MVESASASVSVDAPVEDVILSIADLEEAASKKLDRKSREFFNSGSTEQRTIRQNSLAFSLYWLRPRVLVNVSGVDTSTTCFGNRIAFPLSVSPAGLHGLAHPDGEAGHLVVHVHAMALIWPSVLLPTYTIDEVRAAGLEVGPIAHTMQLYTMKNRGLEERIIATAEKAGCKAIFLTADSPVLGVRYNEWRNDFRTPVGLEFPVLELTNEKIRTTTHDNMFLGFNDDTHNWERDIPWLKSKTKMQIFIKGVLTAEDTELAIKYGCDGIIVSNHGGRQLDGVPATLDALPECVEAAAGRISVHVDGGFRTGGDIFKALALGADCCWVGKACHLGIGGKYHHPRLDIPDTYLQYDGEKGVAKMLQIMHDEFRRCMQLTGCVTVKDITKAALARINADGILKRI